MYFRVESAANTGPDNFIISSKTGFDYVAKFDINGTKYSDLSDDTNNNAITCYLIKATSNIITLT